MKMKTFLSRAAGLNKNTSAFRFVWKAINADGLIRPCYTTGSGRHTHVADHTNAVITILNHIKVKYTVENTAPRGGKTGTLITLNKKQLIRE